MTLEIEEAVGQGDDEFARLRRLDGQRLPGWYRVTQLAPASAVNNADATLLAFSKEVVEDDGLSLSEAVRRVTTEHPALAAAYLGRPSGTRVDLQRSDADDELRALAWALSRSRHIARPGREIS